MSEIDKNRKRKWDKSSPNYINSFGVMSKIEPPSIGLGRFFISGCDKLFAHRRPAPGDQQVLKLHWPGLQEVQ